MAPRESLRKNALKLKGKSKKYQFISYYVSTDKWGAWLKDPTALNPKQRQYLGTYDTEYLAARGHDRAALKWNPDAVTDKLNFKESDYKEDEELREKLSKEQFRKLLMVDSRSVFNNTEPSPCWKKFLDPEEANGNLPSGHFNKKRKTFAEVLEDLMKEEATPHTSRTSTKSCPVDNNSQEDPIRIVTRSESLNALEPEEAMPGSVQTSEQSPHILDSLAWTTKKMRSSVPFTRATNSSKATSSVDAADPVGNIGTASKNLASGETNGTSAVLEGMEEHGGEPKLLSLFPIPFQYIVEEKQELGGEPTAQNPSKRKRLDIDLNRVPDIDLNGPPHEIDVNWELDNDWNRDPERSTWGTWLTLWHNQK